MTGTIVAVGTFDGVHLGHQAVLGRVREVARNRGLESVAYTFPIPPRAAAGQAEARLLLPLDARRALLLRAVDRVDVVPFETVCDLAPADFAENVLWGRLAARGIVVGDGFRFGRGRSGDITLLRELARGRGVDVSSVPPVVVRGETVSSTRIRALLSTGQVEAAARLLGRPPALFGKVVRGDRIGRTLGFPTANLALDPLVLRPADGVYFAYAFWERRVVSGLLYLGGRPTIDGSGTRCEIHLLEPPGEELVGNSLEVQILSRMRDDTRFPSLEELSEQLRLDAERARCLRGKLRRAPTRILG